MQANGGTDIIMMSARGPTVVHEIGDSVDPPSASPTIRSDFPETWLWDVFIVDENRFVEIIGIHGPHISEEY